MANPQPYIKHPSENFIKFLMTQDRPEAKEDAWVIGAITTLGFPRPQPKYISSLRAELKTKIPPNLQLHNRYHRDSFRFLRGEEIWLLHNPNDASKEATMLLANFKVRSVVESLLLGRVEAKEIVKKVNSRYNEYLTTLGVEAYAHYYWNVGLLRVEEWAQLLDGYDFQKSKALAILQVGPAMAFHLTGFQQQLESKGVLRHAMEALYFDLREWEAQPRSTDRTMALTSITKAMTNVDVRLSEADSQLKDSLKAFEQFRMKHAEGEIPAIREFAPSGNFSNSGAKLMDHTTMVEEPEEEEEIQNESTND